MAARQAAPNRCLDITAWFLSLVALLVAVGVWLKSYLLFDEFVSQGSSQASVSQLPSLRFLRLQIQIAEQQEYCEQRAFVVDSPLMALAHVNRWVTDEAIPEHRLETVREVCHVLREEELPERYRAFCLAKLNKASNAELMMLGKELTERWKADKEPLDQVLSRRLRDSNDQEQP